MPVALLTGATGLIGGELCRLLVAYGWGVIALVRGDTPILGNDGCSISASAYTGLVPSVGQVLRMTGDIAQPQCDVDPATASKLEAQVDLVIHCAASTAFNATDAYYQQTNVAGTAHVLALSGNKPFLHVSTAYVCGQRDGPIAEAACAPDTLFANGYERSKAAAEALVTQSGRPWLIARPSIVVGRASDGQIRRFDSIYGTFKLLAEGRVNAIPATADAALNFVSVDFVADALAKLAAGKDNFSGAFVHICAGGPLPLTALLDAIRSQPALKAPRLVEPCDFDMDRLPKTERAWFEHVLKYYLPYFQRAPEFVTDNIKRLIGLQCPAIDQETLGKLIGYAIAAGFVLTATPAAPAKKNLQLV